MSAATAQFLRRANSRRAQFSGRALLTRHALPLRYASGVDWMVQAGWPPTQAAAVMLVTSSGPMALARGVRNHSPTFAASSYALSEALWARARAIRSPAPPAFASLRGTFGLVSADECWLQLLADDAAPVRTSFTTTAVVLASSDPATFPDEESVSAQRPPRRAAVPRLTASPPPP